MNASVTTTQLVVFAFLCTIGLFGMFLKKMVDLEAAGTILTPWAHIKQAPYKATMSVFGAYLALVVWYYMGMLNPLVAIFTGIAGHEAFDSVRAQAVKKMRAIGEENGP